MFRIKVHTSTQVFTHEGFSKWEVCEGMLILNKYKYSKKEVGYNLFHVLMYEVDTMEA